MPDFPSAFICWIDKKYGTCAEKISLRKKRRDQLVWSLAGTNGDFFLKFPLTAEQSTILAAESFIRGHIKKHCPDFPCHLLTWQGNFHNLPVYGEAAFAGTDLAQAGPNADLQAVFTALLDALACLKEIPLPAVLPPFLRPLNKIHSWRACFPQRLQELACAAAPSLELGLSTDLFKFIDNRLATMPEPLLICLVHNDLDAGNIIVSTSDGKTALSGIIDFERFIFADPLKEFSRFIWLLRRNAGLGNWLWERYAKLFGLSDNSLISLELYWLLDLLNQICNEQFLKADKKWREYLPENKAVVASMISGDFELW